MLKYLWLILIILVVGGVAIVSIFNKKNKNDNQDEYLAKKYMTQYKKYASEKDIQDIYAQYLDKLAGIIGKIYEIAKKADSSSGLKLYNDELIKTYDNMKQAIDLASNKEYQPVFFSDTHIFTNEEITELEETYKKLCDCSNPFFVYKTFVYQPLKKEMKKRYIRLWLNEVTEDIKDKINNCNDVEIIKNVEKIKEKAISSVNFSKLINGTVLDPFTVRAFETIVGKERKDWPNGSPNKEEKSK